MLLLDSPNNTKTQCLFTACFMCLSSRSVCYRHGHFWTVEEHTVSVHPFWLKWRKYFWHTIESTTRKPTTPRQQCGAPPNRPRAHTHDIPSWTVFSLGFSLVRRWFDARKQKNRPEHAGKSAQFSREKAAVSNCRGGSGEQREGVATPADFTDFTDITIYRLYSDIPTCCARRGLRHVFIETIIEISMGQLFRSAKSLGGWFNGTVNIDDDTMKSGAYIKVLERNVVPLIVSKRWVTAIEEAVYGWNDGTECFTCDEETLQKDSMLRSSLPSLLRRNMLIYFKHLKVLWLKRGRMQELRNRILSFGKCLNHLHITGY